MFNVLYCLEILQIVSIYTVLAWPHQVSTPVLRWGLVHLQTICAHPTYIQTLATLLKQCMRTDERYYAALHEVMGLMLKA